MSSPARESERVLAGRYRLERRLEAGGMGTIWRAEHLVLQAPVAVKLIDRHAVPDEDTVDRFLREAKSAAALRSPHVVQILDYGMDEGAPFIVMELLEGENLAQRIRRVGRLQPAETAKIATQVGRAMTRAHEAGIVHRDLKPENVFLVHNADEEIAKVLDFGVAKVDSSGLVVEGARTRTGSILGTPYYMSPEQAQGNKTVDARSDLWALGVIVFECLTGRRPFHSDGLGDLVLQICVRDITVPSTIAEVPPGFDAWFARAVERDPDKRFQTAREMTDALREALGVAEPRDGLTPPPESSMSMPLAASTSAASSGSVPSLGDASDGAPPPSRRPSRADPSAPTLAIAPAVTSTLSERKRAAWAETPLPSELPPPQSGLGSVVAVAAVALGIGLAGGLLALRTYEPAPSPIPVLPPIASEQVDDGPTPVKSAASATARASAAPSASAAPADSASETANGVAASALPSASAAPEIASAVVPKPPKPHPTVHEDDSATAAGGTTATTGSDAGWVKPDWAIPDEEPIKKDPVQEEGAP
jgi:serine/threonine protein kinase